MEGSGRDSEGGEGGEGVEEESFQHRRSGTSVSPPVRRPSTKPHDAAKRVSEMAQVVMVQPVQLSDV